jgi:fused signal recognition particle receptor
VAFLFWKKKRGAEVEASVEAVQPSAPNNSSVVIEATSVTISEPETTSASEKPETSSSPTLEKPAASNVEKPALLEAVELPKRTAKKGIRSLFSRIKFDVENLDDLEDTLIQADFGLDASVAIVAAVKERAKRQGAKTESDLKQILVEVIAESLENPAKALNLSDGNTPYVLLVVGVNGVGKTTTIGKLSKWLVQGGFKVLIGAADTFRAAAVDQVATWAERAGASLVRPKQEGQDPASVAFEATEEALKTSSDILIIDTAGRLQNKIDLMNELDKIRRVIEKQATIAEVLLVIDATTGQNGLAQAKAFTEVAKVTGVVLTKLDGTAKGGIVYSIQQELGIPVKLVGVGEGIDDFAFFDAQEFASGLVGQEG